MCAHGKSRRSIFVYKQSLLSSRIRIKDIALLAGVSTGTVDRVLHGRGEVNTETRDRVLSVIRESGYTPNQAAQTLANRKPVTLAAIIPEGGEANPYWDLPSQGLLRASNEIRDLNAGIRFYRFRLDERDTFTDQVLHALDDEPDGVVLAPVFQDEATCLISKMTSANIPCVLIDTWIDADVLAAFGQDSRQSGRVAARLMHYGLSEESAVLVLKLAGPDGIIRHLGQREEGFLEFLIETLPEKRVRIRTEEADPKDPEGPVRLLNRFFSEEKKPGGIFVPSSRASLVAEFLEATDRTEIPLVGYDLTQPNIDHLRKGTIDFLISQCPEKQGYQSAISLCKYLIFKQIPLKINHSPIDIITRENLDFYLKS